jgi:hypothetical protein
LNYAKDSATLLVIFNAGGVPAFSNLPLHELFGLHLSLDHVIHPQKVDAVTGRLAEAKHNAQKFAIAEQFMLSQLREPQSDALILRAVQKI